MRYKLICLFLLLGFGANAQYLHMLERADSSSRKVVVTNNSGIQRYVTIDSLQSLLDDFSYTNAQIDSFINLLVRYTDTASMLEPYITELEINDTLSVYYTSAQVDSADALRILYTDTAGMLSSYITTLEARSEINDTANVLRNEIGAKADTTITNLLRNDVDRIDLTYNPNSQPILNKHYREVDKQTIYIEEINNAAQGVSRLLNTTLTSGRNAYQDAEVVWMADNSDSTVTYSNKGADFTLSRNGNIYGKDNEGAWFEWMNDYPNIDFQENKQKAGLRLFSYIDYGFYRSRVEADTGTLYSIDTCTQNKIDMSLSSSITMIPDGAKAGKLYSIFPNDGSGDFSVTRATTATRVNAEGLIEEVAANVPRIDHSNGCPDLLIEPQRTNLFTYSEDFSDADWSKGFTGAGVAPIVTANVGMAPDGTMTADRVQFNSNDDRSFIRQSLSATSTTGKATFYVKSYDGTTQYVNGHFGGTSSTDFEIGNEWTRIEFEATSAGVSFWGLEVRGGFTTNTTSDILIWGAQLEDVNSYPTSYIPTEGSTVTRVADGLSISDIQTNNLIGSNQGSFVFHYKAYNAYTGNQGEIYDFRIDANNRMATYFSNGTLRLFSNIAGVTNFNQVTTLDGDTEFKIGVAYDANSTLVYINGALSYTLNGFDLGVTDFDIAPAANGLKIGHFTWFATKLTNAELASLTTL